MLKHNLYVPIAVFNVDIGTGRRKVLNLLGEEQASLELRILLVC
jgi:hypothetical protein